MFFQKKYLKSYYFQISNESKFFIEKIQKNGKTAKYFSLVSNKFKFIMKTSGKILVK